MKYDKYIIEEIRLNCKHQDMWIHAFELYVEIVNHELKRRKSDGGRK
jgi:hypothetical protein